jgi:hypothetical protein
MWCGGSSEALWTTRSQWNFERQNAKTQRRKDRRSLRLCAFALNYKSRSFRFGITYADRS